jgi:hypothetical protein
MATNLALDPDLVDGLVEVRGAPTKEAAVTLALKEYIARREQRKGFTSRLQWSKNSGQHIRAFSSASFATTGSAGSRSRSGNS